MPRPNDPNKQHRRSIRLKGFDYASSGAYFVTIVTADRECLFDNGVFRRVIEYHWRATPRHFKITSLDEWVVTPNHIHGIVVITTDPRRGEAFARTDLQIDQDKIEQVKISRDQEFANASPLQPREQPHGVEPGSLGAIVGNFKSITTRRINKIRHSLGITIWQRNYYEHIVRDESDLNRIRAYIQANPACWDSDMENALRQSTVNPWLTDEQIWLANSNLILSNV